MPNITSTPSASSARSSDDAPEQKSGGQKAIATPAS
jgi:hypothetical protein